MNDTLPVLTPNQARTDRTLARCHDALARRRRRVEARAHLRSKSYLFERIVVAGVSVVYLIAVAGDILSVYQ